MAQDDWTVVSESGLKEGEFKNTGSWGYQRSVRGEKLGAWYSKKKKKKVKC